MLGLGKLARGWVKAATTGTPPLVDTVTLARRSPRSLSAWSIERNGQARSAVVVGARTTGPVPVLLLAVAGTVEPVAEGGTVALWPGEDAPHPASARTTVRPPTAAHMVRLTA